jgi:anti-sigma factor (TIGR02949 family)
MTDREIRSCEQALRFLAAHLDGELDDATGDEIQRHLARCRSCYSRAEFEKRLKQHVATLGTAPVRSQLAERVRAIVGSFDAGDGAPDTAR